MKFRYNPLRNIFIKWTLKSLSGLVAVSAALKDALEQNGIGNANVIHNGIKADEWHAEGAGPFRQRYNLNTRPVILFAGRVNGAKGGGVILDILEEVIKKVPNTMLVVASNKDDYAKSMLIRARKLGLSEAVLWTGWLEGEEMKAAYAAANVVVIPSVCFDSLPTVGLEAMASSRPIVGSCFGGIPELITDGQTGFLANPFDIRSFARKTISILQDPGLAGTMGAAGRQRAEQQFSQSAQTLKYLRLFDA